MIGGKFFHSSLSHIIQKKIWIARFTKPSLYFLLSCNELLLNSLAVQHLIMLDWMKLNHENYLQWRNFKVLLTSIFDYSIIIVNYSFFSFWTEFYRSKLSCWMRNHKRNTIFNFFKFRAEDEKDFSSLFCFFFHKLIKKRIKFEKLKNK